jgi:hypothetical protein
VSGVARPKGKATDADDLTLARLRELYPPILDSAQVAELLSLNVRTVMSMAIDGRLPASRLPDSRKYHFFLEDIIATLRAHPAAEATDAE